MAFADPRLRRRRADGGDGFNRRPARFEAEALTIEDQLVAARVQVREPVGEFDFLAIDGDRAEGALPGFARGSRHVFDIDRQEPADPRLLIFEVAAGAVPLVHVDDILLELKGNEAVCGKVGVLHVDSTGLQVNVRDTSDFDAALPEVLRSVVLRLQEQAMGLDGAAARQALVLLHKTLRSLGDQTGGGAKAVRRSAAQ